MNRDTNLECDIIDSTVDKVSCVVDGSNGAYTLKMNYVDGEGVDQEETCESMRCLVNLDIIGEPYSTETYERPTSREEDGRRNPNYQGTR